MIKVLITGATGNGGIEVLRHVTYDLPCTFLPINYNL